MIHDIESIQGKLQNGKLNGKGLVKYKDQTQMSAMFYNGVIKGKVLLYDKWGKLQALGLYDDGFPNGPFWIFYYDQIGFIHFKQGHLGKFVWLLNVLKQRNVSLCSSWSKHFMVYNEPE